MDFTIKKPKYYVGVETKNGLRLITAVDYAGHTWRAYDNEVPYVFTKKLAEEMVVCLEINGTPAVVLYTQPHVSYMGQPFIHNRKEK